MPLTDYITAEEAAHSLNYSVQYVRRMLRCGKLAGEKMSGVWLVQRESLEAYNQVVSGKSRHDPTRGR